MTDPVSNDNSAPGAAPGREPDAHGQAALLLVESVIHGLIANSSFSVAEAVGVVDVASEVKIEVANELGDSAATKQKSLALLAAIGTSLRTDLPLD